MDNTTIPSNDDQDTILSIPHESSPCTICNDVMILTSSSPLTHTTYFKNAIQTLPCNHVFHGNCITPWVVRSNTCPLCRDSLPRDFPIKAVLTRLILHIKSLHELRKFSPSTHTFQLLNAAVIVLDQDPESVGPKVKQFYIGAMQQLHTLAAAVTSKGVETVTTTLVDSRCANCRYEIYYFSTSSLGTMCPVCRCRLILPKIVGIWSKDDDDDVTIKLIMKGLIGALDSKKLDSCSLIYRMFECIFYLLARDPSNLLGAKRYLFQVHPLFDAWMKEMGLM